MHSTSRRYGIRMAMPDGSPTKPVRKMNLEIRWFISPWLSRQNSEVRSGTQGNYWTHDSWMDTYEWSATPNQGSAVYWEWDCCEHLQGFKEQLKGCTIGRGGENSYHDSGYGASQCGTDSNNYNLTLRLFCGACLHTTSDDNQTRLQHTTQTHNKHHHHGGGAAHPSRGVDLIGAPKKTSLIA